MLKSQSKFSRKPKRSVVSDWEKSSLEGGSGGGGGAMPLSAELKN